MKAFEARAAADAAKKAGRAGAVARLVIGAPDHINIKDLAIGINCVRNDPHPETQQMNARKGTQGEQ